VISNWRVYISPKLEAAASTPYSGRSFDTCRSSSFERKIIAFEVVGGGGGGVRNAGIAALREK
jgi:hypothetical protein